MQAGLVQTFVSPGRVVTASLALCIANNCKVHPLTRRNHLTSTVRKSGYQVARSASQPMEDELLTAKVKDNSKVVL